ncbi:LacI family DNA-binding transcriptional regulator [Erwinia sorbitola]|uniref:Substrate-binding domain-containing protein n=1 Tax=Erwinia sorbitola TaxID=2681984 RepID=A0A6I6EQ92_9GAMM|nr:LacI family DNA-binding transcriptional regulator [Erwinia sorbitola]MTD27666.1 substrate-binding domain-containing protein [Erwinia sorbitola]QGU86323.1 substrate-binding domain-containing protein [Erwinia sorbitola]
MKFSIKQIAAQAGVSKATVDRALHKRGAVHAQTERRISQAIRDLEQQQRMNLASGRTIAVDVIMHTPARFSQLVTDALLAELGSFAPFRLTLRLHIFEEISAQKICQLMLRCASDSYGIILKAESSLEMPEVIAELLRQRVPVVTLVTDLPDSERIRYVGMDNHSAGQTAAWLMSRLLVQHSPEVAVVTGSPHFLGEEERAAGFCTAMSTMAPGLKMRRISEGYGIDAPTFSALSQQLAQFPGLGAVYCAGGGNTAILRAFSEAGRTINAFIGHDLDSENRQLLCDGKLDAIIHHELQQDARRIFQSILAFHGFISPPANHGQFSKVSIITPYNM